MPTRGSPILSIWSAINFLLGQKWAFWVLLFVIGFVEVMPASTVDIGKMSWKSNGVAVPIIGQGAKPPQ